MATIPRGVKGLLLVWAIFLPYMLLFYGRMEMGLTNADSLGTSLFLGYLAIALLLFVVVWKKVGKDIPRDDQDSRYVPWTVGLALAVVAVFAVVSYGGDLWRARSSRELVEQELPGLLASRSTAALQPLLSLGGFLGYDVLNGSARIAYLQRRPAGLEADYAARARFQNGEAVIRLHLVRHDSNRGWQIESVSVDSARGSSPR